MASPPACRPTRRAVLALGLLLAAPAAAAPPPLTVFAAASLTDAMREIGRAWTGRTGQPVRFSFASSGILARQVEAGAPADLFVSADAAWMDHAVAAGAVRAATRRDIAGGRLVLVAPRASRVALTIRPGFPLVRALAGGRLAIGDPGYVPAGAYAQTALTWLGVWPAVAARTVRADNVRTALSYVARGEAPLGIVYESDAAAAPGVRVVGVFPTASHPPIRYPAALTSRAGAGAAGFLAFCRGGGSACDPGALPLPPGVNGWAPTPDEWTALWLTLRVAGIATAGGMLIAVPAAWTIARTRLPGRGLFDALLHLPLILPPVVVGFALLSVFGAQAPVGRWLDQVLGLRLAFTAGGAALAAGTCAFPLMLRSVRQAIEAVDPRLEAAARGLGAGRLDRALSVTLPLAAPGLLGGAVVGFAAALGEFGAVITFAASIPGETQTLPLAIYAALQVPGGEGAATRLSAIAFAIALAALVAAEALTRFGRRRIAR